MPSGLFLVRPQQNVCYSNELKQISLLSQKKKKSHAILSPEKKRKIMRNRRKTKHILIYLRFF